MIASNVCEGGWLVVKIDASVGATQILPYYSHGSNFITSRETAEEKVVVLLIKAKVSDPPADIAPLICDSIMNQDDDDVKANCQMSLIHCY